MSENFQLLLEINRAENALKLLYARRASNSDDYAPLQASEQRVTLYPDDRDTEIDFRAIVEEGNADAKT